MKKILSFILTLAVILTSFAGINMFSVSAATVDDIFTAAEEYVKTNENAVTADGLLAAVQAVDSSVTLDTTNDFYIKYAVPGVKDVMADGSTNEYPLNIEGSDGAVAAIFGYNGARYGFTCGFAHEVETIEINEVAVVGESAGFTYSENQTFTESGVSYTYEKLVTGYSGTADKIVIPEGFKGTFSGTTYNSSQPIRYGSVEVLIVNNTEPLYKNGFEGWSSLKAVQFAERTPEDDWILYSNPNAGTGRVFCHCHELKYVKLPSVVLRPWEDALILPQMMFCQCWKLENLNLPTSTSTKSAGLGWRTFDGTIVKEFNLPQYYTYSSGNCVFNNSSYGSLATYGKQKVNLYTDDMTFVRAAALATAAVNKLSINETEETIISTAKSAITGTANSESFKDSLNFSFEEKATDTEVTKILGISNGNDQFSLSISGSYTLSDLSVTDYRISPKFDSSVLEYTLSVPYSTDWIAIEAIPVQGATVGEITGNMNLSLGNNTVIIPVTSVNSKAVNYTITVFREEVNPIDEAFDKAKNFVAKKGNAITAQELLEKVREIVPEATLDIENDFYVKHAVNGVKDNTTDYPLNIEGSNGAVAAIFGYKGKRYGFTASFSHKTEVIEITQTAVVGQSSGFTYDAKGNVTAYTGTADKIVFPSGYAGTMTNLADKSSVNNVKVLIYNNGVAFVSKAFNEWDGLVAVQLDNGNKSMNLGSAVNNKREDHMFSGCDNLKYFKFPQKICNTYYWNAMFPNSFLENCPKLETIIMPQQATSGSYTIYGYQIFYGSAIRDAVWPSYSKTVTDSGNCFGASSVENGTRNIHYYADSMTFVRAAALAAAAVNEAGFDVTEDDIKNIALNAVTGSSDSESFRNSLMCTLAESITNTDFAAYGKIIISNGTVGIPISIGGQKTLVSLKTGYSFAEIFAPELLNYTVAVPENVTEISVDAVPAKGAVINSITGNTNLEIGDNNVTVSVTSTEGKEFTYTINVIRLAKYDNLLKGSNFVNGITLSGNTVYATGEFLNLLKADTNYEISYLYTGNVIPAIKGFDLENINVSQKDEKVYARAIFTTPVDLSVISDTRVSFAGQGTVTDIVVKEVALKLNMVNGATVRFAEPKGMRFSTKTVGKEYYGEDVKISFGTLICPTDYLGTINFNEEALRNAGKSYLDIKVSVWDKNDDTVYNAVISNIKKENYGRAFSAISYADIAYSDGTEIRIYSDYEADDNSRSVYYVAQQELLDTETSYTEYEKFVLENYKSVAEENPTMYVSLGSDNLGPKVQVVTKYSSSYDMVMVLKSLGGNNIFNISSPLKIANTSDKISNDLASASYLIDTLGGSDWFGPHKIYAVNNADGDNQGSGGYTGGSHNYNNNENPADATPTGRSANVRVVVDGVAYDSTFEGYANYVDIYWDTYVQAGNTIKADGSGREVMVEHHHMTYDGTTWLTDTEFEFLEEVKWVQHYGMQCVNGNNWNGEIKYEDGDWISISASDSNSNDKFTDTMTMRKNGHYLEMHLDNNYDLGDRRYIDSNTASGAFSRIYSGFGKSYFYLVNSNNTYIGAGETVSYRGYYRFYYSE